ncbi:MAG: glycosyltransferase family 2 protein [Phycisphaerae bacterium]
MSQSIAEYPFVSVIMPIRNEADFIKAAIQSVLSNDYPRDKMEVLVVDGMSDDGTREIVLQIAASDSRVRLIDNAQKIVPHAMNIGLREMKGDMFTRLDGHAEFPADYIRKTVECLQANKEAWVAGGAITTVSSSYIGKAISQAMQTCVGVGNSMFRRGGYEGWVDTLAFGTHHKWIIDKIGYFDEGLVRNQDDDFNLRILKAGGKIWLSSSIKSIYYSRSSLKKLWRQYSQYGFWRIKTMQKHKSVMSLRQLAPLGLVVSLGVLAIMTAIFPVFCYLLIAEVLIYLLGIAYGFATVARNASLKYALVTPLILVILHFGYGFGMIWGIVRFVLLRGAGLPHSSEFQASR